ncbi:DUF420 domain-containing protein [Pontibacter sp. G13]|uniref:DUF420 domain-containing protein n=1 Tax=Pontibacter sp. G13 TaxID=3074898 RepID=UPI00288A25F6|nr:DUF420 domain-containing protein [Pontibacter sp. G13]WNJ16612.1 DUF420 domain-containing protein [Pontibacter sp. G13]
MQATTRYDDKIFVPIIWVLSVAIPVVVAILMTPGLIPKLSLGFDTMILPKVNASINGLVAICLMAGFVFVKQGKVEYHRIAMGTAFGLSALFLVSYVTYHLSTGHVPYCEDGLIPSGLYYFLLISHVLLSGIIVPLATFTVYRAVNGQLDKHRKLAKITFPIWMYIAVSGVLVVVVMSPCYG